MSLPACSAASSDPLDKTLTVHKLPVTKSYCTYDLSVHACSAASSDLLDKTQTAQRLLKVVIAGLSEDAQSDEVRKVWVLLGSATLVECCINPLATCASIADNMLSQITVPARCAYNHWSLSLWAFILMNIVSMLLHLCLGQAPCLRV